MWICNMVALGFFFVFFSLSLFRILLLMKHATAVNIAIHGTAVLLKCRKALVEAIELFNK